MSHPHSRDAARRPLVPLVLENGVAAGEEVPSASDFCFLEGKSLRFRPNRRGPEILQDVNTSKLQSGKLCAVMGASGSGKTTLLKVLSGRLRETGGHVLMNGQPRGKGLEARRWKQQATFIPQEDVLPRSLTARQAFRFQAKLYGRTGEVAERAVQSVLDVLKLARCADTQIGDGHTLQGLSGGERKRCSVGLELLKRPRVFLLDEPTSGLDGPMALELISMLRALCCGEHGQAGNLAICTIHQPSSKVFALFDHLLLLRNGQVIYCGPAADAAGYFESLSPAYKLPELTNPAEHLLDILQGESPPPPMDLPVEVEDARHPSAASLPLANGGYRIGLMRQFWLLLHRTLLIRFKDPAQSRVRLALSILVAAVLGFTYFNVSDAQGTLNDRCAVMFGCLVFLTTNTMITTAITFPLEKAFVFREYHNGAYRLVAWYAANMVSSLLMQLIFSAVYVAVLYNLVGLRPGMNHFLFFLASCSIMGSIGIVLGTLLGIALPAVHMVTAVVTPLTIPQLVFSGFMIRPGNIPVYFKWLYYTSFFQYSFQLLLIDQLEGFEFENCDPFADDFCPLGVGKQMGNVYVEKVMGYEVGEGAEARCWTILSVMLLGFLVGGYWVTKLKASTG